MTKAPSKSQIELLNDLQRANERIGKTEADHARWLISRFNVATLDNLSSGDRSNYQCEVAAFSRNSPVRGPSGEQVRLIPEAEELEVFHNFLLDTVKNIFARRIVKHEFKTLTVSFGMTNEAEPYQFLGPVFGTSFADKIDLYRYRVLETLFPFLHLIRKCPHCSRTFVADRTNQTYCSKLCQNRAGISRLRKVRREAVAASKEVKVHGKKG